MYTSHKTQYTKAITDKTVIFSTLTACTMLLIFVLDLEFTAELYIGGLYIIVVMLSLCLPTMRYIFIIGFCSTILTMFGYFYSIYNISPTTYMHKTNVINLSMTVASIWMSTIVAMYIKQITLALKKSQMIHTAILDTSIDPILMISKRGIIEAASKTISKTFGWSSEEIVGKRFEALLTNQYKDKYQTIIMNYDKSSGSALIGSTHEAMCINRMRREFPCEISLNYIEIPELNEVFFTAVLRDINARKSFEQRLGWLSSHDDLTKIYNRRFFNEQIAKEWRRTLRSQESLALIMLDIDHFKNYNDAFGHQIGDQCLIKIASCLQESCHRASDIVARYGGEEFVILLPGTNLDGARQIAANIVRSVSALNIPHPNSRTSKKITVSIGIAAMIPTMGCSYERLIHFADHALYAAKQNGRNKFSVHQD